MVKEILLNMKLNHKSKLFLVVLANLLLLFILWLIPVKSLDSFSLCVFYNLTGKPCWNCGMTRAFLSIMHFRLEDAINYNPRVVIVFPLIVYLYARFLILKFVLIRGR